jgi:hypothetical protein
MQKNKAKKKSKRIGRAKEQKEGRSLIGREEV